MTAISERILHVEAEADPARGSYPDPRTSGEPRVLETGLPGASLDAEYARRKQVREDRIRGKHPRIGGLLLALSGEPASTTAFATGAAGERATASQLEKSCAGSALFLHNRRLSRSSRRGDIDHIAITASGIWVIDSKRYGDKKVEVRRTGRKDNRQESLFVGGRDCPKFVEGFTKQIGAVRFALDSVGIRADVHGVLCFIDANLPIFKRLAHHGSADHWPERAAAAMIFVAVIVLLEVLG